MPSEVGTESSAESEKVAMINKSTAGRLPATGSTSPRILASSPVFCMLHCDFFMALLSLLCYRSRRTRLAWPVSFSFRRRVAALRRRSTAVTRVRCSLSPRVTARSRRGVPDRAPFQPPTPTFGYSCGRRRRWCAPTMQTSQNTQGPTLFPGTTRLSRSLLLYPPVRDARVIYG